MKKFLLSLLILAAVPASHASLTSVTASFTSTGTCNPLMVNHGDRFTYAITGTFVGTVQLERTLNGGATYESVVADITAPASGTLLCETRSAKDARYRVRCSTYTSGTIAIALTEYDETIQSFAAKRKNPVLLLKKESVVAGYDTTQPVYIDGVLCLSRDTAPRTNITPPRVGAVIYNSTDFEICHATATNKSAWCISGSSTTACHH